MGSDGGYMGGVMSCVVKMIILIMLRQILLIQLPLIFH